MKTVMIATCVFVAGCTPAQFNQAQRANDARTYACQHIENSSNPKLSKAKKLCTESADVQQVLAASAGEQACSQAFPQE